MINEIPVCNECEDPEEFNPERRVDGHETDHVHELWQFGGGCGICVGCRMAFRGLFINVARLVFTYHYKAVSPRTRPQQRYWLSWSRLDRMIRNT